jgi:hypothetical protein
MVKGPNSFEDLGPQRTTRRRAESTYLEGLTLLRTLDIILRMKYRM